MIVAELPEGHAARALGAALGAADADRLLLALRQDDAPPDALFDVLMEVVAMGDAHRMRACCRTWQKALERR